MINVDKRNCVFFNPKNDDFEDFLEELIANHDILGEHGDPYIFLNLDVEEENKYMTANLFLEKYIVPFCHRKLADFVKNEKIKKIYIGMSRRTITIVLVDDGVTFKEVAKFFVGRKMSFFLEFYKHSKTCNLKIPLEHCEVNNVKYVCGLLDD